MNSKRMFEFCWYHANGDCAVNAIVLRSVADIMSLNIDQRVDLAYMYSITYCVASALYLFHDITKLEDKQFVASAKLSIHFTSDRKYVKMGDRFEKLVKQFLSVVNGKERSLVGAITDNGKINTQKALKLCSRWYYFLRYSSFLFVETLACLLNIELTIPENVDFGNDRMRFAAGIFNVFSLDKAADVVERTRRLPYSKDQVQNMLEEIQRNVEHAGGNRG